MKATIANSCKRKSFIHLRCILFALIVFNCFSVYSKSRDTIDVSDFVKIVPLSEQTYLHISYIPYNGTKFPCNGLVFIKDGQAVVMDTPVGDEASIHLIEWIMNEKKATVNYLIVNHFHEDCMSGLTTFVGTGCQTISHKKTCKLAGLEGYNCTQRYFEDSLTLNVAGIDIISYYFGPAHTDDNIVTYIPTERILFGGCMVKANKSGKGNLLDANKQAWPKTVSKVKSKFPKVKMVVPGHGDPGNKKLLKYTIKLFS